MDEQEIQTIAEIAMTYDCVADIAKFLDEIAELTDSEDIMAIADAIVRQVN